VFKKAEGYECASRTISGCKSIVFFLERLIKREDDRVSFVGCGVCGSWAPDIAFLRFFTPNPFSRNEKWTFINVHFWKS
jgi:hypothetical protein